MLVNTLYHFEYMLTSRHSSGTGASAIYSLLGCATRRDWHFIATGTSILLAYRQWLNKYTQRLIRILLKMLSSMSRRMPWKDEYKSFMSLLSDLYSIQVFLSKFSLYFTPTYLQHADDRAHSQVDFTMCNPPFYSDRAEVLRSAEAKELGPNAVCTGADTLSMRTGVGKRARWRLSVRGRRRGTSGRCSGSGRTRRRRWTSSGGRWRRRSRVRRRRRRMHGSSWTSRTRTHGRSVRRWWVA